MKRLPKQPDFDAVYDIYMDDAVAPFLGYDPMSRQDFLPIFTELLRSGIFFVYEVDNVIAGFFKVDRYPGRANHVAYVGSLAIKPSRHGTGIAQRMMREVIDELQVSGVKRIELIVESDNPKGIRFYQSLGFEIEGTLKKFYKRAGEDRYIDDYIMALLLD